MPQNTSRSAGSRRSSMDDREVQRDNQQIQDDNQTSGESVVAGQTSGDARQPTSVGDKDTPNQAANKEPARDPARMRGASRTGR